MSKKISLRTWAERNFDPPPCRETLRRWVRALKIYPEPVLVGREYYVEPDAKYVATEQKRYGT